MLANDWLLRVCSLARKNRYIPIYAARKYLPKDTDYDNIIKVFFTSAKKKLFVAPTINNDSLISKQIFLQTCVILVE